MRARILDSQVKLYSSPEANALSLATLTEGTEIELGGVKKKDGKLWVEVIMPTGQKGYILGNTRIFHFRLATLLQKEVNVYSQPTSDSLVRTRINKNTKFYLTEVVKVDGMDWVKVRDLENAEGYIPGQTRIRVLPEKTKALAKKSLISGAMWLIGGTVVTIVTYSAPSNGGSYIIAWGAILYGAVQLIIGFYQYFTART